MTAVLIKKCRILATAIGALVSANAVAVADEPAPTRGMPPAAHRAADESIWMFGKRDKLCLEWTDGCRGCLRSGPDDFSCSNIGIACQPQDIRCTSRTTEPPK